jgi:hypothetical protein
MKAVTVKQLKTELSFRTNDELVEICLTLSKFKKENKELLTYLLFESNSEQGYISSVKAEVDVLFEQINTSSYYFIKKSVRKILRRIKTYNRYSKNKETEVELLLYFCKKLGSLTPSVKNNTVLTNLYWRELDSVKKKIRSLHEDLQYDYNTEIDSLIL